MKYLVTYECYRFKQWFKCEDVMIPKWNYNSLQEEFEYLAYKETYGDIRDLTYIKV